MPSPAKREQLAENGEELAQIAAAPLREREGRLEICLVTTRETGRWTIPKGWPMKGKRDRDAAAIEARQEAGLVGSVRKRAVGDYVYWKRLSSQFALVRVKVFRLDVTNELDEFSERGQRSVQWFSLDEATRLVEEPGLVTLLTTAIEASAPRP
jgi:8-oxo-dGTP pyrophosphatase MutT (NUDIX family)